MNEIYAAIIGSLLIIVAGAVGWLITKVISMDGRLIRMETLSELNMQNLMTALHSPHSPEFDRFVDEYKKRQELTWDEWNKFKTECEKAMADPATPRAEVAAYAQVKAQCEHKLLLPMFRSMRYPRRD